MNKKIIRKREISTNKAISILPNKFKIEIDEEEKEVTIQELFKIIYEFEDNVDDDELSIIIKAEPNHIEFKVDYFGIHANTLKKYTYSKNEVFEYAGKVWINNKSCTFKYNKIKYHPNKNLIGKTEVLLSEEFNKVEKKLLTEYIKNNNSAKYIAYCNSCMKIFTPSNKYKTKCQTCKNKDK